MLASQLSHSGKKKNEVAEAFFGVEPADALTDPDRGRSPTRSYMHASAHMIHAARLIAAPRFPLLSSFNGLHMHSHAQRRHFQMSYLHHCGGRS